MKVGLARLYTRVQDPGYNLQRLEEIYTVATTRHLDLLLAPRLAIGGLPLSNNYQQEDYLDKLQNCLQHLLQLTRDQKTRLLLGHIRQAEINKELHSTISLWDTALFLENGQIETEIFRKEVRANNQLEDYRYFIGYSFLQFFSLGKKNFAVLLADDIISNFNIVLLQDRKPDYIICLGSSIRECFSLLHQQLLKLAKFIRVPVFYLNNASYHLGFVLRGEILLINEDAKIICQDNYYRQDELLEFEIDCDDGSELFVKSPINSNQLNPLPLLQKYFCSHQVIIDEENFSSEEIQHLIDSKVQLVSFKDTPNLIANYIRPDLFQLLDTNCQRIIKNKIIDILCNQKK